MARRDFNLKTSLVYSKDILDGTYTEGSSNPPPMIEKTQNPLPEPVIAVEKMPKTTPRTASKTVQKAAVPGAKETPKVFQQTFRMSKSDYDIIKGLIVYQRMNGKPTFTRGDAIALWIEWIQEKCPDVKPFTEEL